MMQNIHFKSARTVWMGAIYWVSILISIGSVVAIAMNLDQTPLGVSILVFSIVLLSGGVLAWIWFDTGYHLEAQGIRYHSGPIKGKIPYTAIREIEVGKTAWAGTRPALATRGIIIRYNKYDEVYISPETNSRFVNELRRRIESLQVKNNT